MIAQHVPVYVGCAGWSLPAPVRHRFPAEGSHLERYAQRFPAVEINSSFYRPHRPATYARWAESVPASFRFSVKMPKAITHVSRLVDVKEPLAAFVDQVSALGDKLGCLLVQLPPSFGFEPRITKKFFALLRKKYRGTVVFEPRHPTWFTQPADELLKDFHVGRVAADPAPVATAVEPGGSPDVCYFRLHGSPRMYYSAYTGGYLDQLATKLSNLAKSGRSAWCIFDNTALGAATANAFDLQKRLFARESATTGNKRSGKKRERR